MSDLTPAQATEIPKAVDKNPAAIYLAGLAPTGRRTMAQVLDTVAILAGFESAETCPWALLRFQHVTAIRSKLEERYKPATINKALAAIRGTLKAAWLAEQMSGEDYHKAAAVKSVKGSTLPAGRELSGGEISALMATCENDPTPAGTRDAALIALAYAAGLRREELSGLELADFTPETGRLLVRGKGNKERVAWLTNGALHAAIDWLALRGSEPGALFQPINKGGRIQPHAMTPQAVYNAMQKRADGAGVSEFSPHDMRRTFVSDLLDAGADIVTVSKMAGHANVATTARYDRRPDEAKRKAAGLLHVPYRGKLT